MKHLFQKSVLRVIAAIFAVITSFGFTSYAAEVDNDLGQMQLDTSYSLVGGFKSNQGYFVAPSSGILVVTTSPAGNQLSVYSDEEHENRISELSGGYTDAGYVYSIAVEENVTYYFYSKWVSDNATMTLSMSNSLEASVSPTQGSVFSVAGEGRIDIKCNVTPTYDKITVNAGGVSKQISGEVHGAYLMIYIRDAVKTLFSENALQAGDSFTVKIEGFRSSADASCLYNGDGVMEINYVAAAIPVELVSITNENGEDVTASATNYKMLSYFLKSNPNSKLNIKFSGALDPTQGSASLQYGSAELEGNNFYEEKLPLSFSDDNTTITLDFAGKLRRPSDMVENGANYGTITLALNRITDAEGQFTSTETQGSLGSYNWALSYSEVSANIAADFEPVSAFGDAEYLDIFVTDYTSLEYEGISFSSGATEVIVPKSDMTITPSGNNATILVPIPDAVRNLNNVVVTFANYECADGLLHLDDLTTVYGATMSITASSPIANNDVVASLAADTQLSVTISNTDYNYVMYQIRDLNPTDPDDAFIITASTLYASETPGVFTAQTYRDYKFIKGHTYRFEVMAWAQESDSRGSGFSNPAGSAYFTFEGSTEPFTFSDIKFVSIDPEPGTLLTSTDQNTFVVNFDSYVKLPAEDNKINLGQGVTKDFESIVPAVQGSQYASTWTLTVDKDWLASQSGTITLSLKAYDSNEKIVEGNQGIEEYSYFQFTYEVDFGTPDITFNPESESTVTSLSSIAASCDLGIGESYDTSVGAIEIYKNRRELVCTITNFDYVADPNDEWAAPKTVNMILDNPITEEGSYMVVIPRGYFILGEEMTAYKNKAYTLYYTVAADRGEFTVESDPADGSSVESATKMTLTFPNYEGVGLGQGKALLSKKGSEDVVSLGDAVWGEADNQMVQPLGDSCSQNGTYTVTFPAGYFLLGDTPDDSPEFSITFTVGTESEPEEPAASVNFTSTPADGSTVESATQINIVFTDYEEAGIGGGKAILSKKGSDEVVSLGDAEFGVAYNEVIQPLGDSCSQNGTYTVTFPAGYFLLGPDAENSPEFSITFTVGTESEPEEPAASVNFTSTPADGSTVESATQIDIFFTDYEEAGIGGGKAILSKKGSDEVVSLGDAEYGVAYNEVIQPLGDSCSQNGTYTVTFPAGYFLLGPDAENSPEFSITFTVGTESEPEEPAASVNFTSTPADGSTVESATQIDIFFTDYEEAGIGGGKAILSKKGSDDVVSLGDAEYGVAYNEVIQPLGDSCSQNGTYTVTFPAGYFLLGPDAENSPEFSITFTVGTESEPEEPATSVNFTSTPADGSTVESATQINIVFTDYEEAGIGGGKAILSKKGSDEVVSLGDAEFGVAYNEVIQPLGDSCSQDGTYTVTFPAGYFLLGPDGENSPEFSISFTVDSLSGISNVTISDNETIYYDLNGFQVKNPGNGIYIVREGNKVSKRTVKK